MNIFAYLWSLPYLRWDILFCFLPTILVWGFFGKFLLQYKKTITAIAIGALLWGIPLDILATPVLHVYFYPGKNVGIVWQGIPLEELFFLLFIPQAVTCILLIIRGYMYGKIHV